MITQILKRVACTHNKEDISKIYSFMYKQPCYEHAHLADRSLAPDTNNTADRFKHLVMIERAWKDLLNNSENNTEP